MRAPFRTSEEPVHDEVPATAAPTSAPATTVLGTAILPRNFTVTTDERVRGIVHGLPAFVRRRRRIEDLEAELVVAVAALDAGHAVAARVHAHLERLNRLIDAHNRYYPIEANLPTDVRTGRLFERDEPWLPLEQITIDTLRARRR